LEGKPVAATNTTRLKAGVSLPGLRVAVAVLVKRTTLVLHLRLRFHLLLVGVHLELTLRRPTGRNK